MLPLLGLRDFEAAARAGSFAAAATELGVTPGAVSQQVKSVEERTGVRLFERRPQSLVLTDAGRTLLPALSSAFDTMENALARISPPRPHSALTLAMPAAFAIGWFLPRLKQFHVRYPRIQILPRNSSGLLEPSIDGADAAFRHGRAGWGALDCTFLFNDTLMPLCSPSYIEACAASNASGDTLSGHTILVSEGTPELWSEWQVAIPGSVLPENVRTFGDDVLLMQAALNGLGIALLDRHLASEYLQETKLIAPFGFHSWEPGTGWYLVYDEMRRDEQGIAALVEWLLHEIEGDAL
jgi:DNA-binding transcriptional LysR family regulator